jgi:hypothetical protein
MVFYSHDMFPLIMVRFLFHCALHSSGFDKSEFMESVPHLMSGGKVMKKNFFMGILSVVLIFSLGFMGCSMDGGDSPEGTGTSTDPLGLESVTINGVAVDIGFRGTVGFAGGEGWGFNSGGAQNGGIYSAPNEEALANVTIAAVPKDSGASVEYGVSYYSATPPANVADPEFSSPPFSAGGTLGALNDLDFIAVQVTKGEAQAWYKFRVAIDAPLLGAGGVSANGTRLGWTIPDLQWTHNQGAYFHNNVGPNPDQSIGLIIQESLPLNGATLTVDVPEGATATWAIATGGNNNTGVALPAPEDWKPLTDHLPGTIASGSLLSVRVVKGTKTLYYNWWVYSGAGVKLSALSVAGNVVDSGKLISFADSWSGAALQEIIVPADGDLLEGAKITWTEPLGMGLAIAVTNGTAPAEDDWLGTSRGQNESYAIVVQPPAVDLEDDNVLSIRARISDKVWYYKAKINFRDLTASDADLTGLSVGGVQVGTLGTPAASVSAATAGQTITLTLSQATNAVIAPLGGPNAEFLFIKAADGTNTPGNAAGWLSSGTISFDSGDYLIIQAFAGELDSKYYKFPVTVSYPNADDVKVDKLLIGGTELGDATVLGNLGSPWIKDGASGTNGSVALSLSKKIATVQGMPSAGVEGLQFQYALVSAGSEPDNDAWKESTYNPGMPPFSPPSWTHPIFTFEDSASELWIKVAAGTRTVKTYKLTVTVNYPDPADVKLASLSIGSGTIAESVWGTPWVDGGANGTKGAAQINPAQNGASVIGAVPPAAAGSTIKYARAIAGAGPASEEDWKEATSVPSPWGPPTVTYPSFTFEDNDELWIKVAAGTQTVKTYKIIITIKPWAEADAVLDSLSINGDFNFGDFSYGYTVNVIEFGTPNAVAESVVAGSFSVEAGKQGGMGVTGLYVNAVSSSGATIHFAKKTTTTTPEETDWVASTENSGAPASFQFGNNNVFWVRVTAGEFVKYYKFTVTVSPAAGA